MDRRQNHTDIRHIKSPVVNCDFIMLHRPVDPNTLNEIRNQRMSMVIGIGLGK